MISKVLSILAHRALLLVVGFGFFGASYADNPAITHNRANLPIPCAGGCGADNLHWVGDSNAATWNYAANNGSKMVVTQQAEKAILNWQSFNIGRNNSVEFVQPSAASEILNRIHGADPSNIAGKLTSNGQIYLLNQNGIMFKGGAQINVGGLVATTLNIEDETFKSGFTSFTQKTPSFQGDSTKDIVVDKGASLKTASGGRVMLIAANVSNEGLIETPDGQTILAAGAKAYVETGIERGIPGLLVEVDGGGRAVNLGEILVGKGDAELVGLAVYQAGRISARTSVRARGSIRLLAQDTVINDPSRVDKGVFKALATVGGELVLGENSLSEVLPDLGDDERSVDEQIFSPSRIELHGKNVDLKSDSRVVAPGGTVDVIAALDPSQADQFKLPEADAARGTNALVGIRLGPNAVIDVSGTTSTVLPMSRNVAEIELRGIQLADSPLQRDGILRAENVAFDVRTVDASMNIPLADLSAAIAAIGRTAEERSAVGGTIEFKSHGEILAAPSSRLNVSGGSIRYDGGVISTTKLVSGGRVFDIAQAPADLVYDEILGHNTIASDKWKVDLGRADNRGRFEAGYIEGKDAGKINLAAPFVTWGGELTGSRTEGPYQREPDMRPGAGSLTIGWLGIPENSAFRNFVTKSFVLNAQGGVPGEANHLDTDVLRRGGLGNISVYSNETITVAQGAQVLLPVGGTLTLQASQVDILADIRVPGGSVDVRTRNTGSNLFLDTEAPQTPGKNVSIAAGVRISSAGEWTNDGALVGGGFNSAVSVDGGKINLASARDLLLAEGTVLDVQGGAWLRSDDTLRKGKGGSISLATQNVDSKLQMGSQVLGFGFGAGGSFSLTTTGIDIVNQANGASTSVEFTPAFFGSNGFSALNMAANAGDLTVHEGVEIAPQLLTRVVTRDYRRLPTGASLELAGELAVLPDDLRKPINFSFSATAGAIGDLTADNLGRVSVANNAKITGEPGAAIQLASKFQLEVLGEIRAPAGSIALQVDAVREGRSSDDNYYAQQGIWLGADSLLAATGVERLRRNGTNSVRVVEDAGSVSLLANAGYLMMEPGASVDISAVKGTADVTMRSGSVPEGVATVGRAGRLDVRAAEALFLGGAVSAHAAEASTPGGELVLNFGRGPEFYAAVNSTYPMAPRLLELRADSGEGPMGPSTFSVLPKELDGAGAIDVVRLQTAGFDSIRLNSDHEIRIGTSLNWSVPGSLILDAQRLSQVEGVEAAISSNYLGIGNYEVARQVINGVPLPGDGKLSLHGQWVDLVGNFLTDGIGDLTITADRDLRLRGLLGDTSTASKLLGSFHIAGDLTVAASRVYPVTLTDYTLRATGPDNRTIRFDGIGHSDSEILSAAGQLLVKAPVIEQFGDLRAPHGSILLEATRTLDLGPESTTSVAGGASTVALGSLYLGQEWLYNLDASGLAYVVSAPPEKRIDLKAPVAAVHAGAVIDISGGGDLSAYEFQKGIGGSLDVLLDVNAYAILPVIKDSVAPFDYQHNLSAQYSPNRLVRLNGVPGLADGSYTLLPAHYALLPGAFLVREVKSQNGLMPGSNLAQPDGSFLVVGHSSRSGSLLLDNKPVTYRVSPASLARQQSYFVEKTASQFFADLPRAGGATLPADAGRLTISAETALRMDGVIRAAHSPEAQGAKVDISAPAIRIAASGVAVVSENMLVLDALTIARFDAEDLFLGGLRRYGANEVTVDVAATHIVVDPNVVLEGESVTLVASDEIRLERGATVRSVATANSAEEQHWVFGAADQVGDGALLQVSPIDSVQIERKNSARKLGTLVLGPNSLVQGRSIVLDATAAMTVGGIVEPISSIDIGVPHLILGDAPAQTEGTKLATELTKNWEKLDQVHLRSYGSIDFYGNATLGSHALKHFIIETPALHAAGAAAVQDVRLAASELILRAGTGQLADRQPIGERVLTVSANSLKVGKGANLFEGFSAVNFDVATEVVAVEEGSLQVQGDLSITAPLITTATGVNYVVQSSHGALDFRGGTGVVDRPESLGGRLSMSGTHVSLDTLIDLPSGEITITATGAGGLNVGPLGVIRSTGRHVPLLAGAAIETPGGAITLRAEKGDLMIDAAAVIDVSAGGDGVDAGSVNLIAPLGSLIVDGTIWAETRNGGLGGAVVLDGKKIADLDLIAQKFSNSGFDGGQSYRVRDGDIRIGAGLTVSAGDLLFVADDGGIDVDGTLAAARPNGGSVRLVARNDVTVNAGGRIQATASALGRAGVIELESTSKSVQIKNGSRIEAGSAETGGMVRLIASRPIAGTIKVDRLPRDAFVNVADLVVVGMVDESARVVSGKIDVAGQNKIKADLVSFNAGLQAQRDALGADGLTTFRVVPGVRIDVQGNLNIADTWDFSSWRYGDAAAGAEAGLLVLRASGNITLNSSLSDGFTGATILKSGPSWSYRVVAGADRSAADTLAYVKSSDYDLNSPAKQTLTIASSKWIRTGQGEIRLAAAQDIVLAAPASSAEAEAVVYTAGVPAAALDGFIAPAITTVFPVRGGGIELKAGRDVVSGPTKQLYTAWMRRASYDEAGATWGVNFAEFRQGVAALAGGDVDIVAGNNIVNLSASVPTIGRSVPSAKVYELLNSGDVRVSAGGDIRSGLFYVGRGALIVRALGKIALSDPNVNPNIGDSRRFSALYAVGQGVVDVRARQDVDLDAVINPTILGQGKVVSRPADRSQFFTYAEDSSALIVSLAGNVNLRNSTNQNYYEKDISGTTGNQFPIYPPNLRVWAPVGDIEISKQIFMFPSSNGQFELLSGRDIRAGALDVGLTMSGADPASLPTQRSPATGLTIVNRLWSPIKKNFDPADKQPVHAGDNLPALVVALNDVKGGFQVPKALRVIAGRDISNLRVTAQNVAPDDVTEFNAGRDLTFPATREIRTGKLQKNDNGITVDGPGKVLVIAGRDVKLGVSEGFVSQGNEENSTLSDRGADVFVYAGVAADYVDWLQQNIQPQTDEDVNSQSVERLLAFVSQHLGRKVIDPVEAWSTFIALPAVVQRPLVLEFIADKGITGDYIRRVNLLISSSSDVDGDSSIFATSAEILDLHRFVSQRLEWKQEDIRTLGLKNIWLEKFTALPSAEQRALAQGFIRNQPLAYRLQASAWELEDALRDAGNAHNKGGGYDLGWNAIGRLFPAKNYAGSIDIFHSQIKAADGGDVRLFVPNGIVDVGVDKLPGEGNDGGENAGKDPAEKGILTLKDGLIAIFAGGDVLVNEARVFTLKGGDILIWSSEGSIDAGRGAKTAISAPAPKFKFDKKANKVTRDYGESVKGSGIRSVLTDPTLMPGGVDLIAPNGSVNAGDAGIGSAGTLNIAAAHVTGTDNIQVTGTSTGVPTTDVGSLSVGLSGQADASANATKGAQESIAESSAQNSATPNAGSALAYLEVMIQEFGGE